MDSDTKYWMIQAMQMHGGSFIKSLAMAWLRADPFNAQKLENTFPEYVKEYTELGQMMKNES